MSEDLQSEAFRAAMASFAAGVTIVTSVDPDGGFRAMTATAFSSVSLDPPLCLVCIDRRARTNRSVASTGCFAVNILRAGQESLSARFASARKEDIGPVGFRTGQVTACPILEGALAWIECRVVEVHYGGDHDIFLGRVVSVRVHDGTPLVYFRGSYSTLPPPVGAPSTRERLGPVSEIR